MEDKILISFLARQKETLNKRKLTYSLLFQISSFPWRLFCHHNGHTRSTFSSIHCQITWKSQDLVSLMTTVLVQPPDKKHMKYVFHNKFRMIFHDQKTLSLNLKNSRLQMFFKIDVLNHFAIFTRKYLCRNYF